MAYSENNDSRNEISSYTGCTKGQKFLEYWIMILSKKYQASAWEHESQLPSYIDLL